MDMETSSSSSLNRKKRSRPDFEHSVHVDTDMDADAPKSAGQNFTVAFLNTAPCHKPEILNTLCGRDILPINVDQGRIPITLTNKSTSLVHGFDLAHVIVNYKDGSMNVYENDIERSRSFIEFVVRDDSDAVSVDVALPFEGASQFRYELPEMITFICMPIFSNTIDKTLSDQLGYMYDIHVDEIIWCHDMSCPLLSITTRVDVGEEDAVMRYIIRHFLPQIISLVVLLVTPSAIDHTKEVRTIEWYFTDIWKKFLTHIGRLDGGPYCPHEIKPFVCEISVSSITTKRASSKMDMQIIKEFMGYLWNLGQYYNEDTKTPQSILQSDFDLLCSIFDSYPGGWFNAGIAEYSNRRALAWASGLSLFDRINMVYNDLVDEMAKYFERAMVATVDPKNFETYMYAIKRNVHSCLYEQLLPCMTSVEQIGTLISHYNWEHVFKCTLQDIKWACV